VRTSVGHPDADEKGKRGNTVEVLTILIVLFLSMLLLQVAGSQPAQEANMNGKVQVRYMENNIATAVSFYTEYLGFKEEPGATPNFAILFRGDLELVLSTNYGPEGAAKPMSDGRKAEPGEWNRITINVDNLQPEVAKLKQHRLRVL
jgi:hypothetical protein